ncbi:hypothetical protein F5Y14DRAFT_465625 [Nemania sp. NC0429]|nr:hypothetical protein F5Y14DRAFT_465625 [Nemania sp. NC0429]
MSPINVPLSSAIDNDGPQTSSTWPPTRRLTPFSSGSPYHVLNRQDNEHGQQQYHALPSNDDGTGSEQDKAWYSKILDPIRRFLSVVKAALNFAWVAEVLSSSLAVLSLLAIVIVVRSHERQPLPSWPLGIRINALVAIFATLLKAALTLPLSEGISQLKWQWFSQEPRRLLDMHNFDSASRGPWGSFLFLFRSGLPSDNTLSRSQLRRHFISQRSQLLNSFAKISAILILLTFAMDPFTQQIVQNVSCQLDSPEVIGRVPRSNTYLAHGRQIAAQGFEIDPTMDSAINRGILDPPSDLTSLLPFECPTGNCSIPSFSTIGLCHTCQDVAHLLKIEGTSKYGVNSYSYLDFMYDRSGENYTLEMLTRGSWDDFRANGFLNFKIIATPIPGDSDLSIDILRRPPVAAECTLQPCVRTYQANIKNSVLNETEIGRSLIGLS